MGSTDTLFQMGVISDPYWTGRFGVQGCSQSMQLQIKAKPLQTVLCCRLADTNEAFAGLATAILLFYQITWVFFRVIIS